MGKLHDLIMPNVRLRAAEVDASLGPPDLVLYNASGRVRGAIVDFDPTENHASGVDTWRPFMEIGAKPQARGRRAFSAVVLLQ
jgi:hypothetical protein